jgi:hypothetical protein
MHTRINIARPHRQTRLGDRVGMRVMLWLTAFALFGALAPPAFAQARASTLTPSRDSAAPGATLSIAVRPALAAQQPAGSHLVLRSARRGGADVELRIVDWRGDAIRASIPRDAGVEAGATRLVLLDRRNEVIAHSGNQMFRVAAAGEVPSEGRTAGGSGSLTNLPGTGPAARIPGTAGPDVASRGDKPHRSGGAIVPSTGGLPEVDPRADRGVNARSGAFTTPGMRGQARDPEISNGVAGARSARGPNRVESDFVVIGDDSRTIPSGMRAPYSFDLPADARPTGRAVLFYVINPDSPPGGVNAQVGIYLNDREIRSHNYSDSMVRTMFETLDANRLLRPGANTLEFRARGTSTKVSDIVLLYHRLEATDAPPPPAKAARTREPPPQVVIREQSPQTVIRNGPPPVVIR